MATALVPGSFNPIHLGHVRIVEAVAGCFDRVIVAAVGNPNKPAELFTLAERIELIESSLSHLPNVSTAIGSGLVVDLARDLGADVLIKGIRTVADLEVETQMAHMNEFMAQIPTMFVPTARDLGHLSSSLIREIARLGGKVGEMVPPPVGAALSRRLQEQART